MDSVTPTVSWQELQKRKLVAMSESVNHFKEVSGMKIFISPNVYPPGTDTYLLANTVQTKPGSSALDLCTGTGAIAIKMAQLGAGSVVGVDLNPRAVENANENKRLFGLDTVTFKHGNMFEGIQEKFDTITINPPYTNQPATNDIDICFFDEDHHFMKDFFANLRDHLNKNGAVYIAWSNIGPMDVLPALAAQHDFELKEVARDIGGRGYTFYVYILVDKIL
jgi:release factor glutamine methyltransferase